jgi:hypothetical protein
MGKTQSKPLAARHVRGTAWARHAMCELALSVTYCLYMNGLPVNSIPSTFRYMYTRLRPSGEYVTIYMALLCVEVEALAFHISQANQNKL